MSLREALIRAQASGAEGTLREHNRGGARPDKVAGAQRNLFSACPQYAAARDYRVHLFLIVPDVIVLRSLCALSQLELIDPEPATPS